MALYRLFSVLQDETHQAMPSVSSVVNSLLAELTQKLVTVKFVFKSVPKLLKSKPRNIFASTPVLFQNATIP